MIIDAHVRIGTGREVDLSPAELLATMDALGIDQAVVAPSERCIAYDNREGNETTTTAAAESNGRLLAYAVANPWRGQAALDELDRARDAGAVALAVDSVLQGFDLLDGLLDPLLDFAAEAGWFVYVRTGTPASALPLPLASLARRRPELPVVMGKSGATDFWIDAVPALLHAPNLYGDTSYAPWDTVLTGFLNEPGIGAERLVFSTDAPYTVPLAELDRIRDWPVRPEQTFAVLGGTLAHLLGASRG
ncbi:amidohydrolase family protein [Kribbella sp. NPDC026611]|uniref:amidohydrolase family protein n=1 Tax=Kribbella sp. NPDC026611 TaxID=3154911 RepID=UPI003408B766